MMTDTFTFKSIGILTTPFREKFGVPRQSLMMSEAKGVLTLHKDVSIPSALRNLEQFSHIWIVFVFHKSLNKPWHPLIDTPRIAEKMGVFATRSPHRPNCIGMSALKLDRVDLEAPEGIQIHVSGLDLLDGTPVLDIKPYVPYADRIDEANSGWILSDIQRHAVSWSDESLAFLSAREEEQAGLKLLIEQMLELDPRPTSQRRASPIGARESEGLRFAFRVLDFDVKWIIQNGGIYVGNIVDLKTKD